MSSKKIKNVQASQRSIFIAGGIVAVLLFAAAATMFGYSLRTAVYQSSISVSPSPHSSPTPTCVPLSSVDVQNITNQINYINNTQIPDENKKVAALAHDIVGLSGDLTKLEAALKSAKDQNTKKYLQQQVGVVQSKIVSAQQQIGGLQNQIQQLYDQIAHLHDILSHNCNNQGSPTLAP